MLKKLPILTAFLALGLTGLVHGRLTDRWGRSPDLAAALGKLKQVPLLAGDWDGTISETNDDTAATKSTGAYVTARFVNRVTGETVAVTLVCGRPGALSLHTPTICLPSHGYAAVGPSSRVKVAGKEPQHASEFMVTDFAKRVGPVEERVHVLWAYGHGGEWLIPENPRVTWARDRADYKLYVSRPLAKPDDPLGEDPSLPFLRAYLPELQKVFPRS
jgi:hypothetical protein